MDKALTFDDVALVPYYNNVSSRFEPNLETWISANHRGLPIIPANMESVMSDELAEVMASYGGIPIFSRSAKIKDREYLHYISMGVNSDLPERTNNLAGVCVDIAHGHSNLVEATIKRVKDKWGDAIDVIAGNVCTGTAVHDLVNWGADAVKVGIGPGAACTTRTVTGFGIPQFTAIQKCAMVCKARKVPCIADGGIKTSGDIVKALAAGANSVMIGKLFSATYESGAEKQEIPKPKLSTSWTYARYRGQASAFFQREGMTPEGEEGWIPVSGSAKDLIETLLGGIRSGLTYAGARSIEELQAHAQFVEVNPSFTNESNTRLHS